MPHRTNDPAQPTFSLDQTSPREAEPADSAPTVSHGRYLLGGVLGSGGFGRVYRATDTLTGEAVAIKFVPALSPSDLARARRELAALRWLRLPGVVRLRDDGLDGSSWFMVMDLVEGHPFDELDTSGGWESWEPCVLELLEVLARVHLAGVLHLDLKPGNVLVTPEGRIILLDLGIARGRAVPEVPEGRIEGTPRYMAPEQRQGGLCDARTDLYAVGSMLALMAPELPPLVQAVVSSMRSLSPQERPASALAAYRALAGRSPFPIPLTREGSWGREELRSLFAGVGLFTHVPEDAAALLWDQTGGQPEQVQAALESWILAGHATWRGAALVVDRLALERIGGALPLDLLGGELPKLLSEVRLAARGLRHQGRLDAAVALLEVVLPLARTLSAQEQVEAEEALLDERILAAVAMERVDAADLALYALDRSHPSRHSQQLSQLVRLARSVLRGEGAGANAHAAYLTPFEHPELEIWRTGYRARTAEMLGRGDEDDFLRESEAWIQQDPLREAKRDGWLGNYLYRRGEFREAALAHERAAAGKSAPVERLASIVGAASAWLDALELAASESRAQEAVLLARELRHPRFEAIATWLVHTVAYRACRPSPPDGFLLESAAEVGPDLEGLFAATDAATAYRADDRQQAIILAERSAQKLASVGVTLPSQLMRALAAYLLPDPAVLATLAHQCRDCPIPDMELQILAFARWRTSDPDPDWLTRSRRCAERRPPEQWTTRLDILSVEEALADAPPEDALG